MVMAEELYPFRGCRCTVPIPGLSVVICPVQKTEHLDHLEPAHLTVACDFNLHQVSICCRLFESLIQAWYYWSARSDGAWPACMCINAM